MQQNTNQNLPRVTLEECQHESLEQCDTVFNHVDDEHVVGHTRRDVKARVKSKAFGIVVYGDSSVYSTSADKAEACEENKGIHIFEGEGRRRQIMQLLMSVVYRATGKAVVNIVQGHEHGDTNGKCHFQMAVFLEEDSQTFIKPGKLVVDGITYLYMVQKARNNHALNNYCKKDGDFIHLDESKKIKYVYKKDKKGEKTDKVDPWATVAGNRDILNRQEAHEIILTHEPRTGITMYKNIDAALGVLTHEKLPDFEWVYPEHMKTAKYGLIEKWFNLYCAPEDMLRRKALVILGKRGCGKSEFAERLVNHEAYRVSVSGNFNAKDAEGKTPKLLILDDITHYDDANKECWKRLVVGQTTNINGKYCNLKWDYKVPCIILTNNKKMFKNLYLNPEFGNQCMYYAIPDGDFIGPEGTKPVEIDELEADMPDSLREYIEEEREKREEAKLNPSHLYGDKDFKMSQMIQMIQQLKTENLRLQKKRIRKHSRSGSASSSRKKRRNQSPSPSQQLLADDLQPIIQQDNRIIYNNYNK